MENELTKLTEHIELFPAVSKSQISSIEIGLEVTFPPGYTDFLQWANGGEGEVGSSYLSLWKLEDLEALNRAYEVEKFAPGLILIGSDGGDMAYAIDKRQKTPVFVEVPFIGMGIEEVTICGNNFTDFLRYILFK